MVTEMVGGHYYRWTGPRKRPGKWNSDGEMDFMLDGKPHLCTNASGIGGACFRDSPDPTYKWSWRDGIEHIVDCGTEGGWTYIPTISRSRRRSAILSKLSIE